jgi:hypothetical protein
MRDAGDVEGGAPVTVTVLAQVEIVAGAMQASDNRAHAGPGVSPRMEQPQLGRSEREVEEAQHGSQVAASPIVRHVRSVFSSGPP